MEALVLIHIIVPIKKIVKELKVAALKWPVVQTLPLMKAKIGSLRRVTMKMEKSSLRSHTWSIVTQISCNTL